MKPKIVRKDRLVEVTMYINRRNIYTKELEQLLKRNNLEPYSKLRFTNDVECYLQDAPHYIEETNTFGKNEFYQYPGKHFLSMKRKVANDVRRHLEQMM